MTRNLSLISLKIFHMLSINIPVYNIGVGDLVSELLQQGRALTVSFEIRVYDDGSTAETREQNRKLKADPEVIYTELPENMGRAAIRNRMGEDSKFQFLLFIDADSAVIDGNYLQKYIDAANPDMVVCGGTAYQSHKPAEPEKLLRWTYGVNREAISAAQRTSSKGFIITSNNFLIEKKVFREIPFRKTLKTYGHEDTLLGFDLQRHGVLIRHINNPVLHTGLENASGFLLKTRSALENLEKIAADLLDDDRLFINQVAFLRRYGKISRFIPAGLLRFIFSNGRKFFERNLSGKHPSLFLFDLYKLTYFAHIKNR